MKKCVICGNKLNGTQKKYCSNNCKSKDYYLNHKSNNALSQTIRYAKRKLDLINIKGGKCEICGYSNNLSALEFHHLDSKEKLFNIDGRNISNKKFGELINEANKCILLCSNCHKEIHHDMYEINSIKQLVQEHSDILKKDKEIYVCKECGKLLSNNNKTQLCKECYLKHSSERRKVERPNKEILEELLKTNSLNSIGKMYGVSHACVKKWGIDYKIIQD